MRGNKVPRAHAAIPRKTTNVGGETRRVNNHATSPRKRREGTKKEGTFRKECWVAKSLREEKQDEGGGDSVQRKRKENIEGLEADFARKAICNLGEGAGEVTRGKNGAGKACKSMTKKVGKVHASTKEKKTVAKQERNEKFPSPRTERREFLPGVPARYSKKKREKPNEAKGHFRKKITTSFEGD